MVDNLPIDFFRNALVEAAVAGLHMENRDFPAFGRDCRKTRICISENQHRIRTFEFKHGIDLDENVTNRLNRAARRRIKKVIGFSQREILEKHFI